MRKNCTTKRITLPDSYFCRMIREYKYEFLFNGDDKKEMTLEEELDEEDDQYHEEQFEDDYSRRMRRAGFCMTEDGEYEYLDEDEEDYSDEEYEDEDDF